MKKIISLFMLCLAAGVTHAQHAGSPYSLYGIGIVDDNAVTYNTMKGGLGLSGGNTYVVNNVNPALLALNGFTIFDFGLQYDQRKISTDSLSSTLKGGGLNYVTLALPIKAGKWGISLGLSPYSSVKYNFSSVQGIPGDTVSAVYTYKSNGGLNQVFFQTGARILKPLFVGLKATYIFGSINSETKALPLVANVNRFETAYFRSNNSRGFLFGLGAAFNKEVAKETHLNIGVIYDFKSSLKTTRNEWLSSSPSIVDIETADSVEIIVKDAEGDVVIPQRFGVGLSLTKEFKWAVGFDFYQQDWSDYENFFGNNEGLKKSTKYILGGEYTPDFFSVNSYLKRVTFLAGLSYTQTPLSIENEDINDFGINFGASLPVTNGSTVNLGFTIGSTGTTDKSLVRENYFKVSLGISFNDQAYGWYRKQRKFN